MSELRNALAYYGIEQLCDTPIMHFGIKGMKWGFTEGVRNGLRMAAEENREHDKRYNPGIFGDDGTTRYNNMRYDNAKTRQNALRRSGKIGSAIGYGIGNARNYVGDRFQDAGQYIKNRLNEFKENRKKKKERKVRISNAYATTAQTGKSAVGYQNTTPTYTGYGSMNMYSNMGKKKK